jgi:hypothetical protein
MTTLGTSGHGDIEGNTESSWPLAAVDRADTRPIPAPATGGSPAIVHVKGRACRRRDNDWYHAGLLQRMLFNVLNEVIHNRVFSCVHAIAGKHYLPPSALGRVSRPPC